MYLNIRVPMLTLVEAMVVLEVKEVSVQPDLQALKVIAPRKMAQVGSIQEEMQAPEETAILVE